VQASVTLSIGEEFIDSTQIIFSTTVPSSVTGSDPAFTDWVRIGPVGQLGPVTDNTNDLGASTSRWVNLYLVNSPFVGIDTTDMSSSTPLSTNEGLNFVSQLNPLKYVLNEEYNQKAGTNLTPVPGFVTRYGLSGQDLANAVSSLGLESDLGLLTQDAGSGKYSVALEQMVPVLVQALQELNTAFNNYVATHP
jgi:hypothetical protein